MKHTQGDVVTENRQGKHHNRNEMSTVNLARSYCLPSLLYGCEIQDMNSSDYHRMNVIWNNAFRKIFKCSWTESVSCLIY